MTFWWGRAREFLSFQIHPFYRRSLPLAFNGSADSLVAVDFNGDKAAGEGDPAVPPQKIHIKFGDE